LDHNITNPTITFALAFRLRVARRTNFRPTADGPTGSIGGPIWFPKYPLPGTSEVSGLRVRRQHPLLISKEEEEDNILSLSLKKKKKTTAS
jgi:hypothetical protein